MIALAVHSPCHFKLPFAIIRLQIIHSISRYDQLKKTEPVYTVMLHFALKNLMTPYH